MRLLNIFILKKKLTESVDDSEKNEEATALPSFSIEAITVSIYFILDIIILNTEYEDLNQAILVAFLNSVILIGCIIVFRVLSNKMNVFAYIKNKISESSISPTSNQTSSILNSLDNELLSTYNATTIAEKIAAAFRINNYSYSSNELANIKKTINSLLISQSIFSEDELNEFILDTVKKYVSDTNDKLNLTDDSTLQNNIFPPAISITPHAEKDILLLQVCPKCSANLPIKALFCNICGSKICEEITCEHCNAINPKGSLFCIKCGTKL